MDSETASDPSFRDPVKRLSRYKFYVAAEMRLLYHIGEKGWAVLKRDTLTLRNWFDPAMRDKTPLPDDIEFWKDKLRYFEEHSRRIRQEKGKGQPAVSHMLGPAAERIRAWLPGVPDVANDHDPRQGVASTSAERDERLHSQAEGQAVGPEHGVPGLKALKSYHPPGRHTERRTAMEGEPESINARTQTIIGGPAIADATQPVSKPRMKLPRRSSRIAAQNGRGGRATEQSLPSLPVSRLSSPSPREHCPLERSKRKRRREEGVVEECTMHKRQRKGRNDRGQIGFSPLSVDLGLKHVPHQGPRKSNPMSNSMIERPALPSRRSARLVGKEPGSTWNSRAVTG